MIDLGIEEKDREIKKFRDINCENGVHDFTWSDKGGRKCFNCGRELSNLPQ